MLTLSKVTDKVVKQPETLSSSPNDTWHRMRGVFTDIDDTITTAGRVSADVFAAMERLRAAGRLVIPITGRPAGWCDLIARQWPVDAVVGENGAFYYRYDEANRTMLRVYADDAETRASNWQRLETIREEILTKVAGSAVSADQAFRATDLAIDFCEDVERLPEKEIEKIVEIFKSHGATAKVSSIHVNGWFGNYDKLTMTKRLMTEQFSVDLDEEKGSFTFVGDSPNDAPMFSFFPDAVGVANLSDFLDQCEAVPSWITEGERGAGFVQVAERVLQSK